MTAESLNTRTPEHLNTHPEICLGPVDAIPLGEGRAFTTREGAVAVFRQRDGRLFATQNECPHQGGPLAEGLIGAGVVLCPLHAFRFDLETGACGNDSACAIRTYRVREEGGRLFLTLDSAARPAAVGS